jgi:periplasmic divalent cation tolerance protein
VVRDDVTEESSGGALEPLLHVVLCTAPPDRAEAIARAVLEKRLAACVNVVPTVTSLYWWDGAIQRDGEALLVMKTRAALVEALTAAIRAVHPYDVPEVIALPIEPGVGNAAYRAWVAREAKGQDGPRS